MCRTWNGSDINYGEIYEKNIKSVIKTGELYNDKYLSAAQKDGRGNICPVTIILPTLAAEVKQQMKPNWPKEPTIWTNGEVNELVENFMKLLDQKIHEAKDQLIERFEWIANQNPESAKFMYENGTMVGFEKDEGIRSAVKHGTLAAGMIGMAETLQILIGCDQTKPEGLELAKRICKLYKDRCAEFKHEYRLNFGVYYTPKHNRYCLWGLTQ